MAIAQDEDEPNVRTPLLRSINVENMEENADGTMGSPVQQPSSWSNGGRNETTDIQMEESEFWEDIARAASPSLLLVAVSSTIILTLGLVLSYNPVNEILNYTDEATRLQILIILLFTFAIGCILFQKIVLMKRRDFVILQDVNNNVFLIFWVVFLFMPLSVMNIVLRFLKALKTKCLHPTHILELIVEIIFIIFTGGYILAFSGRRICGGRIGVNCTKITIVAIQTGCLCFWLREIIIEEGIEIKHELWPHRNSSHDCVDKNSTSYLEFYYVLKSYISPCLVEFLVAAATLLHPLYENSKPGMPRSSASMGRDDRPFLRGLFANWKPLPTICGILLVLILISGFVMTAYEGAMPPALSDILRTLTLCVFISLVVLNTIIFLKIYKLPKQECQLKADRILLWLASFGTILHGLLLLYANVLTLGGDKSTSEIINAATNVCFYAVFFVQALWQTITLDLSLHRKLVGQRTSSKYQPELMLLLANVGLWVNAIQVTKNVQFPQYIMDIYGMAVWSVLRGVINPLNCLLRIHSVTILFHIFRCLH